MQTPHDNERHPWLDELNAEQRQAATHTGSHLLIIAGAGTGKTRTLAYRVAYLVATGTPPERIMLLTFTRRAAEEMLKRAGSILQRGAGAAGKVWGGTFHATANRLLRMFARPAGISPEFTVMDQSDAEDLMNVVRQELGLHEREKRFPRKATCLAIYSRCCNGVEPLAQVLERFFPWCREWEKDLKALFQKYVERKQSRNVLDYDDLLLYWAEVLRDPRLARQIGSKFDHILVDEYQDTNSLQADILRGMTSAGALVTAVGDDAQSIYSFRAANVRNMLDFAAQFPGAATVTLEQNYRSVRNILATTNLVIAQARERYTKNLWSKREEGARPVLVTCKDESAQDEFVASKVLEYYEAGIPLNRQAVLFRAAHHSDSLEVELTRRNIPFHKFGGLRFLEAAHVKDLVAILRIAENPMDEMAWFRTLQLLPGIGPGTAAKAVAHMADRAWASGALRGYTPPAPAREGLAALADLLDALSAKDKELPPATQIERVRRFYDPLLKDLYDNAAIRSRDLENLEQIASGYTSRRRFLVDLQLDPPTSVGDLAGPPNRDEDWLVLSTIHSAKGCEWDVVYLIHAADGCLPSDMATGSAEDIEEEMRLTYVAMTRAKNALYVTWPQRYYHRWSRHTDRHSHAQLCRFLTPSVRDSMDASAQAGAPGDDTPSAAGDASPAKSIGDRIRSRWE